MKKPRKSAWVATSKNRIRIGSFLYCLAFAWMWSFGRADIDLTYQKNLQRWILKGV